MIDIDLNENKIKVALKKNNVSDSFMSSITEEYVQLIENKVKKVFELSEL